MIYKKHDSVFNYHNATGARDERAMYDLIMNDIADTLVHHRQLFVDGLTSVGIVATRDMSNPELIKLFSEGVQKNPQLAQNIAKLIMYKNTKGTGPAIPEGAKSMPEEQFKQSNFYGQAYNAYGENGLAFYGKPKSDGYGGLAAYGGLGAQGIPKNGFMNFNSAQRGYGADIHNTGYLGVDAKAGTGLPSDPITGISAAIASAFNFGSKFAGRKAEADQAKKATEQKLIDLATAKMNAAAASISAHRVAYAFGAIAVIGIVAVIFIKMKK